MKQLDVGCGVQKVPGFIGLDKVKSKDVDMVCDFLKESLPFDDNTIDEVFCGDVIEHITYKEMIKLMNEIYRICKPNAKVVIHTVYGIKGWLQHPPHLRPIMSNQFDYFSPKCLESETFVHMRKADGIKSIYNIIKSEVNQDNTLYFELEVVK